MCVIHTTTENSPDVVYAYMEHYAKIGHQIPISWKLLFTLLAHSSIRKCAVTANGQNDVKCQHSDRQRLWLSSGKRPGSHCCTPAPHAWPFQESLQPHHKPGARSSKTDVEPPFCQPHLDEQSRITPLAQKGNQRAVFDRTELLADRDQRVPGASGANHLQHAILRPDEGTGSLQADDGGMAGSGLFTNSVLNLESPVLLPNLQCPFALCHPSLGYPK